MPPVRRSRDETAELMLAAGAEVLLRDGISVGASTIGYSDAFALLAERGIKVTRGSIHERIWASQEAWRLDVLSEAIDRKLQQRQLAVADTVRGHIIAMPIDTKVQRDTLISEVSRVGALAYIDDAVADENQQLLPTVMAAWKASSDSLPEYAALGELLGRITTEATHALADNVASLARTLDLRPNPTRGLSFDESIRAYVSITSALAYSLTIRVAHDPGITQTFAARCPDGEYRPWNVFGMSSWMTMRGLFVIGAPTAPGPPTTSQGIPH